MRPQALQPSSDHTVKSTPYTHHAYPEVQQGKHSLSLDAECDLGCKHQGTSLVFVSASNATRDRRLAMDGISHDGPDWRKRSLRGEVTVTSNQNSPEAGDDGSWIREKESSRRTAKRGCLLDFLNSDQREKMCLLEYRSACDGQFPRQWYRHWYGLKQHVFSTFSRLDRVAQY